MAIARFSCGTSTGRGSLALLARARLNASTMGGKSVPGLAKKKSTPCSASARRNTSPAIGARVVGACGRTTSLGRLPPVVLDEAGGYNGVRFLHLSPEGRGRHRRPSAAVLSIIKRDADAKRRLRTSLLRDCR